VAQSISGLSSGLDSSAIIEQLLSIERQSISIISSRKDTANVQLASWAAIRNTLGGVRTASQALLRASDWTPLSATSSDSSIVGVSAGSGTMNGSLQFTVNSLASAGSVRSANVVNSLTTNVAADQAIMIAAKGRTIGFDSFASDDALALGKHDIKVTQASAAAIKVGGAALDATTTIGPGDTVEFTVNGSAYTLDNIATGAWTPAELAAKVQAAATAKGAAVTVTVDPTTNALQIASNREGSDATLQITGGTALAALHLTTDGAALVGTNGKVQVGDGTVHEFSTIEAGQSVVLNATAGTVTATFSGGLRAGVVTADNVSVGDGALSTVMANINSANAGVTATAVQVGQGAYRLQLSSTTTGARAGPNVAASELGAAIGSLIELSPASDARITVGSGPGAYEVTSDSNTLSGVLPGVTLTLKQASASPVTVTVARDVSALVAKVKNLVESANKAKAAIDLATAYNAEDKKASPLTGNSTARRLLSDLHRAITDEVPFANPVAPGLAGVSVDKTGKFTFDEAKFTAAFNADPDGMVRAFTQGGTATDANVSFVSAGDRSRPGTYAIEVTALATQGANVGLEGSWPIGTPPTVKVRVGTKEVQYAVQATDTQADVVQELNTRLAQAGLQLEASISGTGIELRTTQYGSAAMFEVAWDGGAYVMHAGTNVEGTIGGKTAVGSGQQLSIPFDDREMGGLAVKVTGSTTGPLGTITYNAGIAQRTATTLLSATDVLEGYVTSAENGLKTNISYIEKSVASMNQRLIAYQARLKKQFAQLETTLSALKSQSEWLSGQVAGMNARAAAG
jgi:flagellar hook-associated protein 2